jgi:glutamate-1-semialdehyde aminotransferase
MMGVGTNILGYSKKEVDDAVRKVINKGNMSTLNSKEEILLAEKLNQRCIHGQEKFVLQEQVGRQPQ